MRKQKSSDHDAMKEDEKEGLRRNSLDSCMTQKVSASTVASATAQVV